MFIIFYWYPRQFHTNLLTILRKNNFPSFTYFIQQKTFLLQNKITISILRNSFNYIYQLNTSSGLILSIIWTYSKTNMLIGWFRPKLFVCLRCLIVAPNVSSIGASIVPRPTVSYWTLPIDSVYVRLTLASNTTLTLYRMDFLQCYLNLHMNHALNEMACNFSNRNIHCFCQRKCFFSHSLSVIITVLP